MNDLNSDLILHIAQYVSVLDAAAWMQTSRRYYYLVHQLRRVLGPEMVAAASATPVLSAMQQLRQPPTLALCCNTEQSTFNEEVAAQLPPSTVVLGAVSQSIQTCLDGQVESTSRANILLGNLGQEATIIQPFAWEPPGGRRGMQWEGTMEQEVRVAFSSTNSYEVFIIYGCGAGCSVLEEFIECVQSLHPTAALVGGICSAGYVSKPVDMQQMDRGVLSSKRVSVLKQMYKNLGGSMSLLATLTEKQALVEYVHALLQKHPYVLEPHLEDAVFGIALGGNVPIRSVVSRGVKRLTPPDTTLLVQESRLLGPTVRHNWQQHQLNPANRTVLPAFHVVDSILDKDTGTTWDFLNFLATHGDDGVDFCGIRRRRQQNRSENNDDDDDTVYEDTFELYALDLHGDKIKIPVTNSDLFSSRGPMMVSLSELAQTAQQQAESDKREAAEAESMDQAQIDFFSLDGESCVKHVEATMRQLKEQIEKENDNVLAAMMFSCAGRGPMPGWLMNKRMADANAFSNAFGGEVPCVGFYAGGEIGPLATAPAPDVPQAWNLFQRGKAALQGFTAVFALFIAPIVDLRHVDIDDSPAHVDEFIAKHLVA